ncbi:hypothetical protein [Actinacidiphila rubida]|uniref:Uncharacterized protein n=1 Tax=Actinacidiphila rubida TaxID=310780 RepID=A0A1H8P0D0_9ACTN|nr:hypothetical protein [Actinacidiphila rubida]SEO35345.1 hypothetical protein SAMN05216267_102431 [Actinacidiphila rubida]
MQNQTVPPRSEADRVHGAAEQRPRRFRDVDRPVFVDASGRRQRRVRRLGYLLVIPAAAYVALVLSTVLGGPSVDSPLLPVPAAGDHRTGGTTIGDAGLGSGDRTPAAGKKGSGPTDGSRTAQPAPSGGTAGASVRPSDPGTASPSASPPATASAAPSATAGPTVTHGKSTATHPTPTHTGHGH